MGLPPTISTMAGLESGVRADGDRFLAVVIRDGGDNLDDERGESVVLSLPPLKPTAGRRGWSRYKWRRELLDVAVTACTHWGKNSARLGGSSLILPGAVRDAGWLGENIQRPTTNIQHPKVAEGQRWLGGGPVFAVACNAASCFVGARSTAADSLVETGRWTRKDSANLKRLSIADLGGCGPLLAVFSGTGGIGSRLPLQGPLRPPEATPRLCGSQPVGTPEATLRLP